MKRFVRRGVQLVTLTSLLVLLALGATADETKVEVRGDLTQEEIDKVVDYIIALVTSPDFDGDLSISPDLITEATGVQLTPGARPNILPFLMARFEEEGIDLGDPAEGASCSTTEGVACSHPGESCSSSCTTSAFTSRCAEYGACSLYGDLTGATGDVLDMYVREKSRDGETYDDVTLPAFEAVRLDGTAVASADLLGQPTVLVTLAGHCSHSFQTLSVLDEIQDQYAPLGVQVVGLFLNSGDAADVASFMKAYDPDYSVLASAGDELGDTFDSHLVPTYLLVDEKGNVKQRLVGYQSKEVVQASLAEHLDQPLVSAGAETSGR